MSPNHQIRWLGDVLWTYNSHSCLFLPYPSLSLKDINTFQCRNLCKCIRINFFMQWTDLICFFFAIRIIRKFFYLKVLNMFIKRVKIINYSLLHAEQLSCRYWWNSSGIKVYVMHHGTPPFSYSAISFSPPISPSFQSFITASLSKRNVLIAFVLLLTHHFTNGSSQVSSNMNWFFCIEFAKYGRNSF